MTGSSLTAASAVPDTITLAQSCRVGVDIVPIADVADSISRFGESYLRRLFTDQERESCAGTQQVMAASLAARVAAKEAIVKVLRPRDGQPDWRSMEVVREPGGACRVQLHGTAARLATEIGLQSLSVSLSHAAGLAVAAVVGITGSENETQGASDGPSRGNAGDR